MLYENIGIGILYISILSVWACVLIRAFVALVFPLKKTSVLKLGIAFTLQFLLHIYFFIDAYTVFPYITIIFAIVVNALIIRSVSTMKLYHNILCSMIYTFMVLAFDMLVMPLPNFLMGASLIGENHITYFAFLSLAFVVAPLVYFGLRWISRQDEESRDIILKKMQQVLTVYALATALFAIVFVSYMPSSSLTRSVDIFTFPFVMVLLAISLVAGNDFLHSRDIQRGRAREYETLQQYVQDMESQSREMQKFRHDYTNILLSMEAYISKSENQELKDFFNNKIKKTAENLYENVEIQNIKLIEIKEIKSILLVKLQKMISEELIVEFEARETIDSIPIDTVVMVRIIGILLDNAIEEAVETSEKRVNVGMIKDKKDIIFYVSNTCREGTIVSSEIMKRGYSIKGKDRGVGLCNLAEFSEKYDNLFVETKCENNRFTQIITIEG